jgi:hypothetical protein
MLTLNLRKWELKKFQQHRKNGMKAAGTACKLFLKCCLQLKSRLFIKGAHGLAIPKQRDKEKAEPDDGG